MSKTGHWHLIAGLPFTRSFAVFENKGQRYLLNLDDFHARLIVRDAEGIHAKRLLLDMNSIRCPEELCLVKPNRVNVDLLPTTTAGLSAGIVWLILAHNDDHEYTIPVSAGRLTVKRTALVG